MLYKCVCESVLFMDAMIECYILYIIQLLLEVIQQEKKRMAKTKSRFPVLTSEKLRAIMAAGKLKMEKMELDQVRRKVWP